MTARTPAQSRTAGPARRAGSEWWLRNEGKYDPAAQSRFDCRQRDPLRGYRPLFIRSSKQVALWRCGWAAAARSSTRTTDRNLSPDWADRRCRAGVLTALALLVPAEGADPRRESWNKVAAEPEQLGGERPDDWTQKAGNTVRRSASGSPRT